MVRAQLSIELFFALALFFLVLSWVSNYASTVYDSPALVYTQEKAVANSLVAAANAACASNTSSSFYLPCISKRGTNYDYEAFNATSNSPELRVRVPALNSFAQARALCPISGYASAECGTLVCMKSNSSSVLLKNGAC
ncbi:MAG: hypothetical protein ACP5O3_01115 [Candidatus Micrarchaeia archaeon]|jgi:hypothetical protein